MENQTIIILLLWLSRLSHQEINRHCVAHTMRKKEILQYYHCSEAKWCSGSCTPRGCLGLESGQNWGNTSVDLQKPCLRSQAIYADLLTLRYYFALIWFTYLSLIWFHRIIESWNCKGWNRPSRASSPTISLAPPFWSPLNCVLKCHIPTSFQIVVDKVSLSFLCSTLN